jgi:cytochrome c
MKKLVLLLLTILILQSCKKETQEPFGKPIESDEGMPSVAQIPEVLGQEIFNGKGKCVACHQIDKKLIGPSIQEIAKIYKDKNSSIVTFLKGEADPIVDPSQFEVMKVNFEVTKEMSDQELKALEAYLYSSLK